MARKVSRIDGQWIAHRVDMVRSPAFRGLGFVARRILDRIEIEHAEHGGKDNGRLPCTYDDFARWGIRRKSIADGLRELEAFGFIEIVQRGRMAAAGFHIPSHYRLTYLHTKTARPSDEWAKVTDDDIRQFRNQKSGGVSARLPGAKTPLAVAKSGGENAPTEPGAETPLLSISRVPGLDEWQTLGARLTTLGGSRSALPKSAVASEPPGSRIARLAIGGT